MFVCKTVGWNNSVTLFFEMVSKSIFKTMTCLTQSKNKSKHHSGHPLPGSSAYTNYDQRRTGSFKWPWRIAIWPVLLVPFLLSVSNRLTAAQSQVTHAMSMMSCMWWLPKRHTGQSALLVDVIRLSSTLTRSENTDLDHVDRYIKITGM